MVVTKKNLIKLAVKHDGNRRKIAKIVGASPQAISDRFKKNPEIETAVLNAREQALKNAGITRELVYRTVKKGLYAKSGKNVDYRERRESAKLCLQLHRDLDPTGEEAGNNITSISAIIYNIVTQTQRDLIEVL